MAYSGQQNEANRKANSDVLYLPNDYIERGTQKSPGISDIEGAGRVSIIAGPPGPKGDRGPPGLPGFHSCECKTATISNDYVASIDDYYIGCINNTPITVILPPHPDRAIELVIKRQLGSVATNGLVSIETVDSTLIDGQRTRTIRDPLGVLRIVWNSNNWFTI